MKNAALWQQISDYQIDAPDAEYPFSARLAQENDWSLQFADLVIAEYKRFIYLSCITKQALTPSREVDEAWHLHLTYTKDYWDRFCKGLLGRPMHHNPTNGGPAEGIKFRNAYIETFREYESEFGEKPSPEFWPDVNKRFGSIEPSKKFDLSANYLVSHNKVVAGICLVAALSAATFFIPPVTAIIILRAALLICLFTTGIAHLTKIAPRNGTGQNGGCAGGGCGGGHGCGGGCGG